MQQKLISLCALLWAVSQIDISPTLYPAIRRLHLSVYERKSISEITGAVDKLLENVPELKVPYQQCFAILSAEQPADLYQSLNLPRQSLEQSRGAVPDKKTPLESRQDKTFEIDNLAVEIMDRVKTKVSKSPDVNEQAAFSQTVEVIKKWLKR